LLLAARAHRRGAAAAQGSAGVSDDENVDRWAVMLVPFSFIHGTDETTGKPRITAKIHWRRAVAMSNKDITTAERRNFYRALLEVSWLPSALRRAVMAELGLSLRKQKRDYVEGETIAMRHMVDKLKTAMHAQGLRPRGGIYEAAVAEVAHAHGMTADALKKRLQRSSDGRKIRGQ
jgi:hypothetical protein